MPELRVVEDLEPLRKAVASARAQGKRIGLVPTMGNLHEGHLSLIRAARELCEFTVATIFVNPLQFGPAEDLAKYPRTFEADKAGLQSAGCDLLFFPAVALMYPQGLEAHTKITVPHISTLYCGKTRPGHFDGVCTVVNKLFNMVQPDHAFFGLKDYQQFHIIGRMVKDLCMPVQLHGLPTIRENSGLAMSSRNGYLSPQQREQAAIIHAALKRVSGAIRDGNTDFRALETEAGNLFAQAGLRPDYVRICRRDDLLEAKAGDRDLIILAAAYAGTTRLIDNLAVPPTSG